MKKKHIVMVLGQSFPPDIRVEKELSSLIDHDYSVSILCTYSNELPTVDAFKTAAIYRYIPTHPLRKLHSKLQMRYNFVHPYFLAGLKRLYQEHPFDAIHVHDLPLAKTALHFKTRFQPSVKVVLDLHENYPEAIQVWNTWNKGLKSTINKYFFNNYKRWLNYEKLMIQQSDHVIAVVKEMRDRMVDRHGVSGSAISVVSNTEPCTFNTIPISANIVQQYKNDFIISYIGGFGPHRGIDTAILGMQHLKEYPHIKLLLVGKGAPEVEDMLRFLINKHALSDQIIMMGWQPFDKVASFIEASNICLIPHHDNPHTSNTIPHKLFQYMSKGKPTLVSTCAPLKRIVEETNSGMVFEAGNPADFAERVRHMHDHPDLLSDAGKRGQDATSSGAYSWENDAQELCKIYHDLIG